MKRGTWRRRTGAAGNHPFDLESRQCRIGLSARAGARTGFFITIGVGVAPCAPTRRHRFDHAAGLSAAPRGGKLSTTLARFEALIVHQRPQASRAGKETEGGLPFADLAPAQLRCHRATRHIGKCRAPHRRTAHSRRRDIAVARLADRADHPRPQRPLRAWRREREHRQPCAKPANLAAGGSDDETVAGHMDMPAERQCGRSVACRLPLRGRLSSDDIIPAGRSCGAGVHVKDDRRRWR